MKNSARTKLLIRICCPLLLCSLLMPSLSGCALAAIAGRAFPTSIPAKYTDLKNQRVAVMVWADSKFRIDWPQLRLDVAAGVRSKLQQAVAAKTGGVDGSTYPLTGDAITRMQDEHPEWAADSIEDVAVRLGVSRLIYIEIENIQTRSDLSVELFRGTITGRIKVIEINDGKARVGFTEEGLRVVYPQKSPEEGVTNKTDNEMYRMTVDAFTSNVSLLFIPHTDDDEK